MDSRLSSKGRKGKKHAISGKEEKQETSPAVKEKSALEKISETSKKDIFGFRTKGEDVFIDPADGVIKPLKTAMLIDDDVISLSDADIEKLNSIPGHRPVIDITAVSRSNSPVMVKTPKQSELPRVAAFGAFSLFSNTPEQTPVISMNPIGLVHEDSDFFDSVAYESVKEPRGKTKTQEKTITLDLLEQRRAEDIQRNRRRIRSQNKAMVKQGVGERKGSATDYANAVNVFPEKLSWEWLHLVAYMVLGDESQTSEHLVGGTAFSNTEMMFAEENLNYLARVYPEGFDLVAKATLIPRLQIGTVIEYYIRTPDFEVPLKFNVQTVNRPHIFYQQYFDFIFQEMVRLSHEKRGESRKFLHVNAEEEFLSYSKKDIARSKRPVVTEDDKVEAKTVVPVHPKPTRVVAIDTETTGLHHYLGDRIVQVGAIEYDAEGKETGEEYAQIIHPERSIPAFLKEKGIHNTTDKTVKNKPKFKEVKADLMKFIDDSVLLAHNADFDLTMLEDALKRSGGTETLIGRHAIDTLAEARSVLPLETNPQLPSHKLSDVCQYVGIDISARDKGHDAVVDARLAGELHFRLQELRLDDSRSAKSLKTTGVFARKHKRQEDEKELQEEHQQSAKRGKHR